LVLRNRTPTTDYIKSKFWRFRKKKNLLLTLTEKKPKKATGRNWCVWKYGKDF
jgi:hypothetical protein